MKYLIILCIFSSLFQDTILCQDCTILDSIYTVGNDYLLAGELELAEQEFDKLIKIDSLYQRAYSAKAEICLQKNKYKDGLHYADKSIILKQDDIEALMIRSRLYIMLYYFNEAESDLNAVLEINPYQDEAICGLATIRLKNGETRLAYKEFKRALEINDKNASTLYNIGTIDYQNGNYRKAIEYLNKALLYSPEDKKDKIYSNLGAAKYAIKDYNGAFEDYMKGIKINPKNSSLMANMGMLFFIQAEFDAAIIYFSKALEINYNNISCYYNRGAAYYYLKDYKKASRDLIIACEFQIEGACELLKEVNNIINTD